jgi:hypothetical protein
MASAAMFNLMVELMRTQSDQTVTDVCTAIRRDVEHVLTLEMVNTRRPN